MLWDTGGGTAQGLEKEASPCLPSVVSLGGLPLQRFHHSRFWDREGRWYFDSLPGGLRSADS